MAIERWVAGNGVGLTWTACFGAELNSLAIGNAVQSSVTIANATALDLLADLSISLGSVTTPAGLPYIGVYLYPLNQDGTTYGDGRFTSSTNAQPPTSYYVGAIPVPASATGVIVGNLRSIPLLAGSFRFVFYNNAGVILAASGNTASYRTFNRQVV